jgi:hypothetical protein
MTSPPVAIVAVDLEDEERRAELPSGTARDEVA